MAKKFVEVSIQPYKEQLTTKDAFEIDDYKEFIKTFQEGNLVRLQELDRYWNGMSIIDDKKMNNNHTPNHKVKANYCKFIGNMSTGYFMGIQPTWKTADKNIDEVLNAILSSNDSGAHEYMLAKNLAKYGVGYEYLWRDEEAHFRFNVLDSKETFLVKKADVEKKPLLAIRIVAIDDKKNLVEIVDAFNTIQYEADGDNWVLTSTEQHGMGCVPIVEYANNLDKTADYESVIALIESYNTTLSNTANDIEAFTDAYLVLRGYLDTDREELQKILEDKVFLLDKEGGADFLTKTTDDGPQENYRNRLVQEIHKISQIPNLTDEEFAGNLSGVAIHFKIIGLDFLTGEKEMMYRKGLKARLEAITDHMVILNKVTDTDVKLDSTDYVTINFNRNMPQNIVEIAQMVNNLQTILSEETLISQLPFIEDVSAEIERKKKESQEEVEPDGLFKGGGVSGKEETEKEE